MGTAIGKIRKEVLSLSVTERASLAHDLIISLDEPSSFDLGDAYETEIKRRVKGIKQGKAHGRVSTLVIAEHAPDANESGVFSPGGRTGTQRCHCLLREDIPGIGIGSVARSRTGSPLCLAFP